MKLLSLPSHFHRASVRIRARGHNRTNQPSLARIQRAQLRREYTALTVAMVFLNSQFALPLTAFAAPGAHSRAVQPIETKPVQESSSGKKSSQAQEKIDHHFLLLAQNTEGKPKSAAPADKKMEMPGMPGMSASAAVSVAPLDLSKIPTEAQLKAAGGLLGPLDTLGNADEAKFKERMRGEFGMASVQQLDAVSTEAEAQADAQGNEAPLKVRTLAKFRKRVKRLEEINLAFGKAINARNARRFPETAQLMNDYLDKYPDSPWAGEAMLHLSMDAMNTGRPAEAQARLQALLDVTVDDPTDPTWEIRCKAKGTWADLDLQLGQYASAIPKLEDMLQNDTSMHRRTWASMWLTQARLRLGARVQPGFKMMNSCGSEALGLILTSLDKKKEASSVERIAPPNKDGFSLDEIARISKRYGVPMRGFRVPANVKPGLRAAELMKLPLPLIVHYDMSRYSASKGGATGAGIFGLKPGSAALAFAAKKGTAGLPPLCPACPPAAAKGVRKPGKTDLSAFKVRSIGHFLVVRALDKAKQTVTLDDPMLGSTYKLSFTQLEREWSGAGLMLDRNGKGENSNPTPDSPNARVAQVSFTSLAGIEPLDHDAMSRIRGACCCPWLFGPTGPPQHGPNDPKKCGPEGCDSVEGSPKAEINPISMNTYISDIPVWYDTPIGPSVKPMLSYNSQDTTYFSSFGNKWRLNYEASIMENPGGVVIVNEGTGKFTPYRQNSAGGYAAPTGVFNSLIKTGTDHFEITEPTGEKQIFDKPVDVSGVVINVPLVLLKEVRDRFGNAVQVRYASYSQNINGTITTLVHIIRLIDTQSKVTVFQYDASNHCSAIVITNSTAGDINGSTARRATFSYDASGNMTGAEDMGGNPFSYTYDTDNIVTTLSTEQGVYTFDHRYPGHNPFTLAAEYNNETTFTDPQGGTQRYGMDMQIGGPYSGTARFFYTDANNHQTVSDYGAPIDGVLHLISSETVGLSGRKDTTFDPGTGLVTGLSNENSQLSTVTYNWRGKVTSTKSPLGRTNRYFYDSSGVNLLQINNNRGNKIMSATYTANFQPDSVTLYPTASASPAYTTSYTYTAWGAPLTTTNPINETTTFNYDPTTKRLVSLQISSPTMSAVTVTTLVYDSLGRIRTSTDAFGLAKTYEYNDLNKPTKVSYPDGSNEVTDYVCCAIPGVTIDRSGRKMYHDYDELKRLRRLQDPEGNTQQMNYDKVGNLKELIDGRGSVTRFDYDEKNRMIRKTFADGSREGISYDAAGRMSRSYDARGQVTKYFYDSDGHLTGIDYPNVGGWTSDVAFGYNDLGRMTSMSDGTGNTSWTYDNLDRKLSEDGPWADDALAYTYDGLGRRKTLTVNGANTSTYNYDSLGRLDTLVSGLGTWNWDYLGGSGLPSLLVAPNTARTSYSYDALERLTGVSNRKNDATTILSSFSYGFDDINKKDYRLSLTRQSRDNAGVLGASQILTFGYDNTDQLKAETSNETNPLTKLSRAFDPMGNRLSSTDQGRDTATTGIRNLSQTYVSNRLNQLTSVSTTYTDTTTGTGTNSYDVRGNLAQSNDTKLTTYVQYRFDDANRLFQIIGRRVSDDAVLNQTTFFYDGLGRKKWILEQDVVSNVYLNKRETYLTNDGMDTVQERDNNYGTAGNPATITTAVYQLTRTGNIGGLLARTKQVSAQPDRPSYYAYDGSGNVATITDASQNVQCNYNYSGFGLEKAQESAGWDQPYRFATKWQHSGSGFVDFGHRFYNPNWGRWINRDLIAENGGTNVYGFVGNGPINSADQYGLGFMEWIYTGEWNPAPGVYDATINDTADWVYDCDPARGIYASWGPAGTPGSPRASVALTTDSGFGFSGSVSGAREKRGELVEEDAWNASASFSRGWTQGGGWKNGVGGTLRGDVGNGAGPSASYNWTDPLRGGKVTERLGIRFPNNAEFGVVFDQTKLGKCECNQ